MDHVDPTTLEGMSDAELASLEAEADRIELTQAKENFAVYCGLHIPAEVEADELPQLHNLSLPARYVPATHHQLMCKLLQCLEAGELHGRPFKNLIIQAPPGAAKSSYTSMLFPAWYMGRHPTHNVIQGSQTDDLAHRFGRRARNAYASEIHHRVFGLGVSADSRAAGAWETEKGGEYYATGVQPFAGRRADCLSGDTVVRTEHGPASIEHLYLSSSTCQVLSYDETTGSPRFNFVAAFARRRAPERFRIHTAAGRVVEATGNHRIRVGRNWVPAASVAVGDVLLCLLPQTSDAHGCGTGEEIQAHTGVPAGMQPELREQHGDAVQAMPHEVAWSAPRETEADTVALVERLCDESWVYDLEVERDHNFFANDILVHNCLILDDLIRGQEDADSPTVREKIWSWYVHDAWQRLKPKGKQIIVACMVGNTRVMLADGTEKELKDVRVGDAIATYDDGRVSSSTVKNWINQGPDNVFAIRTISGRIVKANERHPFLVRRNGELEWVRLKYLRVHDKMTCLKERGQELNAPQRNATSQPSAKGFACRTTTKTDGLADTDRHPSTTNHGEQRIFVTDTESELSSMQNCSNNREEGAPYADDPQRRKTPGPAQDSICASITTITQKKQEDCFATIATSPLGASELPSTLTLPLSIYEIGEDEIVSITEAGREDVFDIEVEETENFIANGLAAHNTRWHEDDPIGRIIPASFNGKTGWVKGKDGELWYVLSLKAVIETEDDAANDPLGRKLGEILWPEWFTADMMATAKVKVGLRGWAGQYQQMPRPDGGAILLSDWWRAWKQELPKVEFVIQVYDTAFEEGEENDYSARTTWGIFPFTDTLEKAGGAQVSKTRFCCILLEAWRAKCEFTELRDEAKRSYRKYRPDRVLIEKRASGHSLIQELRRAGVPVYAANPKWMGRSKRSRAYGAQIVLEDGCVFYPCKYRPDQQQWTPYAWTLPVMDECASFPDGEYNDYGDSVVHALLWLRQRYHLKLTDEDEDEKKDERRIKMFG